MKDQNCPVAGREPLCVSRVVQPPSHAIHVDGDARGSRLLMHGVETRAVWRTTSCQIGERDSGELPQRDVGGVFVVPHTPF